MFSPAPPSGKAGVSVEGQHGSQSCTWIRRVAATPRQSPPHAPQPQTVSHSPQRFLSYALPSLRSEESLAVTERRLQAIFLPRSFSLGCWDLGSCQFQERRNLCLL